MGGARSLRPAIACFLLFALGVSPAAAKEPLNLLRLPEAKLETTTLAGERAAAMAALTDGKPDTTAELPASAGETVDLVYGFGGETVAPEAIVVTLAKPGEATPPSRIEVLASIVSPQSGFHSLRGDPIDAGRATQKFSFRPDGARWIMIRLTVPRTQASALAEIELLGQPGPPATNYAFSETPARAIDILARLQAVSAVKLEVTPDEKAAFERAKSGRLDATGFADTALLASGVLDAAKRKAYLTRLDALETRARTAVGSKGSPTERGEALLKWLHREALAKGYRTTQTDLSVLLDSQTFNCVSSAVIYNILALRLGLDVRAIEVPDHAFSILYEGTSHVDIETTNAQGFNPARDPRKVEAFEKMTGYRYIPDAHRDRRREITEAGLAAIIYYNKGVELSKAKRHHDALLAYFRAMSLDPEFASAAKNALASLGNWSAELAKEHKWQQALDVATVGLTLAPKDALLANNQRAIWTQWAMSLADAGKPDEAIAVLKRAATAQPDGPYETLQAFVYIKRAEELVKARDWRGALAATEPALARLDPAPRRELVKWRERIALRWSSAEIDAGRFEAAAAVLAEAHASRPDDARLQDGVGYLAQEWAKKASTDGFARGLAVLAALDRQFPGLDTLSKARTAFVRRHVKGLIDAGRLDEALATVEEAASVLSADDKKQLIVALSDIRAKALAKTAAWSDAADVYARALNLYPNDDLLKNNVRWLAQEWQKAAYARGGAAEVATVQATLAAKFPGATALGTSGRDQIRRTVGDQVRSRDYAKALETLKGAGILLAESDRTELNELIYDKWAKERMAAKDWAGAADVYAKGLAEAGSSSLLRHNVVYLAQEWARAAVGQGGVEGVLDVARQVMAMFPNVPEVKAGPATAIANAVQERTRAAAFADAIATIERANDVLDADRRRSLFEYSYNAWAKTFVDKKAWDEAIKVYDQGLAKLPDSNLLKQNRNHCVAQRSK